MKTFYIHFLNETKIEKVNEIISLILKSYERLRRLKRPKLVISSNMQFDIDNENIIIEKYTRDTLEKSLKSGVVLIPVLGGEFDTVYRRETHERIEGLYRKLDKYPDANVFTYFSNVNYKIEFEIFEATIMEDPEFNESVGNYILINRDAIKT